MGDSPATVWKALLLYFSTESRPLPGLIYRVIYFFAGFHPLPFRLFCFTLILINLFLLYRFASRLTGSKEIAWLATLLAAYHAWFIDIYFNTSTLEELACFFFYFSAFLYYLRIRQTGRYLDPGQLAVICLLFVCALDSKETAVTLPVFIGLYEIIYSPPKRWTWLLNEARGPLAVSVVMLPFVIGRLVGPTRLVNSHPLYRLDISPYHYLHAFHLYLNVLFYQDHYFADARTRELLTAMAAVALFLRRKYPHLLFCYAFILLSVLPFIFISHYSGFFMYLPMAGWAIYIATVLQAILQLTIRLLPFPPADAYANAVMFLAVATILFPFHLSERRKTTHLYISAQPPLADFVRGLDRLHQTLPKGARVLFLHDPFNAEGYTLFFTVSLYYGDPTLIVNRAEALPAADLASYDRVLTYRAGRIVKASI
jgi:Dolichyl-phosphate-mannose-protein mannosyltransferase